MPKSYGHVLFFIRHNDDLRRHPIVILLEVVNDAAPLLLSQYD